METRIGYANLEFWGEETGHEILFSFLRAAGDTVAAESIHVFNPESLSGCGAEWGECELWISFHTTRTPREIKTTVLESSIVFPGRVKEIGLTVSSMARADFRTFMDWIYADAE